MRIVLFAFGSWGDVRPYVVLAKALQDAGHTVVLLAFEEFREWVETRGVPVAALTVNVQALLDSVQGWGDGSGANVLAAARLFQREISPAMLQLGRELIDIVQPDDVLICVETAHHLVQGIVEKHNLRLIQMSMYPTIPTAAFVPFNLPPAPGWLPARGLYNRAAAQVLRRMTWGIMGARGNQLRTENLGLPKRPWRVQRSAVDDTPHIIPVSRHVLPPPSDWPPGVRVTGYLFDDDSTWEPPQALLDFLAAGEKPVYIGFGSMPAQDPRTTTNTLVQALDRVGLRGVILSGWAGLGQGDLPESVFLARYASHSWLFPRMAAVVHHGGAGTTAAGLRAGVPSVIVPSLGDQPFWGRRVHALGAGSRPIPRRKLTADRLAAALREATSDGAMQASAAELGRQVTAEDGATEAVRVIEGWLG